MTRTYLLQVASQIVNNPVESFVDPTYYGTIYIGNFLKKPFYCLADIEGNIISIIYNNTLYCTTPVNMNGAHAIRKFYELFKCTTKVFLYPNKSDILYIDEKGEYRNHNAKIKSHAIDYSDCIPIPVPSSEIDYCIPSPHRM